MIDYDYKIDSKYKSNSEYKKKIDNDIKILLDKIQNWNCESVNDMYKYLSELLSYEKIVGHYIDHGYDEEGGKPKKEIQAILDRARKLKINENLLTHDNSGNMLEFLKSDSTNDLGKWATIDFDYFYEKCILNDDRFLDLQLTK